MKARIFQMGGLALALALTPFIGGCDEQANSAPVTNIATSQPPADATTAPTDPNQPADTMDATADTADADTNAQDLATAPGTIISTPETASTNTSNNPQITDFVKLVQAGVGEPVLMAYVTNSAGAFNLSSDDVLYLNDLGAPETVVAAMLQRDRQLNGASTAAVQPQQPEQPAYTDANPVPPPGTAMTPQSQQPYEMAATDQTAMAEAPTMEPPLTPTEETAADQSSNGSYSYFYDSLAPYGNWVNIAGYGPCWQPTVVVGNPGWQPYCDRGHWAYTDCGWVWASDYSWGWAPFHYGRWFRNNHFGWCWAPDTVWGPAWVSWRYSDSYCGWAALPPTACYRPGFGFTYFGHSVGFGFGFGLTANRFVFVPTAHFHDRWPGRFRLPHQEVTRVYNTTVVHNQIIRGNNNLLINRGIPVDRVAAATHTEIRAIHVRADAAEPRGAQLGRDGRTLSIYRPTLPTPRPGATATRVGEGVRAAPNFNLHNNRPQPTPVVHNSNPLTPSAPVHRPIISNPTATASRDNSTPNNHDNQPGNHNNNSGGLFMHGPNRQNPSQPQNPAPSSPTANRSGQPQQPHTPGENNWRVVTPPVQQQPANNVQQFNNRRQFQQPQMPQQRQLQQQPQSPVHVYNPSRDGTPKMQEQNPNPEFRSQPSYRSESISPITPSAPQRSFNQQPAMEYRSVPTQPSAPHQEFNPGRSGGGGGANQNAGGGGGGNHAGAAGGSGGGGGGGGGSHGGGGGGGGSSGGGGGGNSGGGGGGGGNSGGGNNSSGNSGNSGNSGGGGGGFGGGGHR